MTTKPLSELLDAVVGPEATLGRAMELIARPDGGIVLVCDADKRLLGIVVDADTRHALLRGATRETPVSEIMNKTPLVARHDMKEKELASLFDRQRRAFIPVIDAQRRLLGVARLTDHKVALTQADNWVVIMAGGKGTRLRPVTNDCPKPMIKIGDKPLLEHLIRRMVDSYGLNRFMLSVNYLADQIKDHFGDGKRFGVTIEYVSEPTALGTAGALSLIPRRFDKPFIVLNGDLLTKVNFRALLDFHEHERDMATMAVREYDFQVPYGVVQLENNKLAGLVEKPVHKFFVNAGIYVLEPGTLTRLKPGERRDMTDLFDQLRREAPARVGCFPIQEYWLDIGKIEDYERAQQEYGNHFPS